MQHWYKEILIGVNIGNMAAFIWLAMIVKPDNYAHLAVNQSILGLFITGAIPAYLESSGTFDTIILRYNFYSQIAYILMLQRKHRIRMSRRISLLECSSWEHKFLASSLLS
jgi:hypothetical protein